MQISDFQLERYLASYEFSAPYLLCTSDCETISVSSLLSLEDGAEEEFKSLRLGYTESQGSPGLRNEIARLYSTVPSDHIVVTAGAEEAIFLLMNILLTPGDHIIVQTPAYQSLYEVARSIGCRISKWELREGDHGWYADLHTLRSLILPETKAVVVNSPHNPTGHLFSRSEWNELNDIVSSCSIRLLSDEVYRGLEHDPSLQLSAAADLSKESISIGVMSKAFGLAGLRIGWIATHDTDIIHRFLAMKDYTTICSSCPSEFLATVALRRKEAILNRNISIVRNNVRLLQDFLSAHSSHMTWSMPVAGSTAFVRIKCAASAVDFCDTVRRDAGVLLLPGTVFGTTEPYVRFGYGRSDMHRSLDQLSRYFQTGVMDR